MRRVAISGASGFVGRAVVAALPSANYETVALARNSNAVDGYDAVIHLRGESVSGRWTAAKKAAIATSRVDGTRELVASLAAAKSRPRVLVCASAVGYYGDRGEEMLVESSAPGNDFLADVCVRWEAAAREAEALGVRVVILRFGVVLGNNGGALAQMKLPFSLGLGGPMGNGRQFLPWIALADVAALCRFALENEGLRGPYNAVAPEIVTNAQFARALGGALKRPAILPAPAFALRVVLGEFAETLLASQRVLPAGVRAAGFTWRYTTLDAALAASV